MSSVRLRLLAAAGIERAARDSLLRDLRRHGPDVEGLPLAIAATAAPIAAAGAAATGKLRRQDLEIHLLPGSEIDIPGLVGVGQIAVDADPVLARRDVAIESAVGLR